MPAVRVVVVNYNSGAWLARCLDSLRRQTFADFEAVIFDNGSTDGSFDVAAPDARFRLVAGGANLGFAAANNRGARGATTRWLALLNPDAVAKVDWLASLLADATRHPDCRIFGSTQLRAADPSVLDGTGDCLSAFGLAWRSGYGYPAVDPLPDGEVFAACGAALMIDRALFESLGGFEERFFCYLEDLDLCFRARLRGEAVRQSARAVVHHAGGGSTDGGTSPFAIYHGNRNRLWMLGRNVPAALLPLALAGSAGYALFRAATADDAAAREASLRGLRDGLRGLPDTLRERRRIQAQRRVGTASMARWLSWNPQDLLQRRHIAIRAGTR